MTSVTRATRLLMSRREPSDAAREERRPADELECRPGDPLDSTAFPSRSAPATKGSPCQVRRKEDGTRHDARATAVLLSQAGFPQAAPIHVTDEVRVVVELVVEDDRGRRELQPVPG